MEFLFELLLEIIMEGSVGLASSRRVPMALRIAALILLSSLTLGLLGLLLFLTVGFISQKEYVPAIIVAVIDVVFIFAIVRAVMKKLRSGF